MSESRKQEARSWADEETSGERVVAEMKRAIGRLRDQFGAYRERTGDNDNADGSPEA